MSKLYRHLVNKIFAQCLAKSFSVGSIRFIRQKYLYHLSVLLFWFSPNFTPFNRFSDSFLEKGKTTELESFLEKLGVVDRSAASEKNWGEIMKEKQVVLPRYMQTVAAKTEAGHKANNSVKEETSGECAAEGAAKVEEEEDMWTECDRKRPVSELSAEEQRQKCIRLLQKTLPKELADQYIKKYKTDKQDFKENDSVQTKKVKKLKKTTRKVVRIWQVKCVKERRGIKCLLLFKTLSQQDLSLITSRLLEMVLDKQNSI